MDRPLCVVFSDAFAYRTYSLLGGIGNNYFLKKIIPGIGYSSNLHYLLFDGKTPDQVGFFTDYTWKQAKAKKNSRLHRLCDEIETVNNIYRFFSRRLTKNHANIPFSEEAFFTQTGKYKFMTENPTSVFGRKVDMAYIPNDMETSFILANKYLEEGKNSIAVVIEELDHIGHKTGSLGEEYLQCAKIVMERTKSLFDSFVAKYTDALCILISDHGMSDVYAGVNVFDGMKRTFGLPGDRYQAYMDSVYLRLWSDNKEVLYKLKEYFGKMDVLVEIDDNQRTKFGVTNRSFGDLIFRLREGYVFQPNSFGVSIKGECAGIHGFMEATESASGILVSNNLIDEYDIIEANDVFRKVKSIL